MKFFKTCLSLLLAALFVFTMSACGGKEPSSSAIGSKPTNSSDIQNSSDITDSSNSETNSDVSNSKYPTNEESSQGGKSEIWNGSTASYVAKGNGTKEFPFLIYSAEELAYAVTEGGKDGLHYQLQNDIYLNDVTDKNWMKSKSNKQWVQRTEQNLHLDGNGYCVYGLWFSTEKPVNEAGLITNLTQGTVQNLGIRNSYVVAKQYAGAFAAQATTKEYKKFENCFVDETVYVGYIVEGSYGAGGFIGLAMGGGNKSVLDIINCYSKAQVVGFNSTNYVNGIIGNAYSCSYTMKNCFSVGLAPYAVNGSGKVSKLLDEGFKASDVYKNVYTDKRAAANKEVFTNLSSANMKGDSAKTNMKGLDFGNVFQTVSGGYPKLKVFKSIDGKDISVANIKDFKIVESDFDAGNGTKSNPYIIKNAAELKRVVSGSWKNTYFSVANDIYIHDTVNDRRWENSATAWVQSWTAFEGYFEGNGHCIYGLYFNQTPATGNIISGGTGLFSVVGENAVIRNIHIRDSYIYGKAYVGAVAGYVNGSASNNGAIITGCSADSSVYLKGQTVGGILGGGPGGMTITYSYFTGTIEQATGSTGATVRGNGIVGDIWSDNYRLAECYTLGYRIYRNDSAPKAMGPCYSDVTQSGVTQISDSAICGGSAQAAMPALNWSSIWESSDEYPRVKIVPTNHEYVF